MRRPRSPTCSSSRSELEDLVVQEVGQTALFGARFRENAARALLIPRRRPGQRTPLWQQRLKAQSLLEVARKYGSFPIVLETYRECLQDVFDLPALRGILHGLSDARARPRRGRDAVRVADGRVAAVRLRRDLHVRGRHARGGAARAGALARPRAAARAARPGGAARAARPGRARRGRGVAPTACRGTPTSCTTCSGASATLRDGELDAGFAETLVRERRAFRARVGGADAVIAAEDAGLYRDAFGVMPPGGLPEAFLEPVDDAARARPAPLRALARPVHDARGRRRGTGSSRTPSRRCSPALEARDLLVRGELRPGGVEREWCDPDVLRRIRRASLAVLRRQVEPAEQAALGRFLPGWHGIDRRATLREALVPLQGLALPVSLWETEILPRRVPGYQPACARPALRLGRGRLGRGGARPRRALLPRGRARPRRARERRAARRARSTTRSAPRSTGAPSSGSISSPRPASTRATCCRRSGSSSGTAR